MPRVCPAGHGEFADRVDRCPECGEPLTAEPPSAAPDQADHTGGKVVYLATAPNETLAQLWIQALRDAGVKAMAKPLGPGFGAWASAFTLEHALYVLESQLETAREVLSDLEGLGFDDDAPESPFEGRRR
jgi:hypothetical protein